MKNAIISNADVLKLAARHPRIRAFVKHRLNIKKFSGLPLTLLAAAFAGALALFFGIAEDIIFSAPLVAVDIRVANLFFAFRDAELISFFLWITLLGKWQIIIGGLTVASILLWLRPRRGYIIPFWFAVIGSGGFNFFAKITFHRQRPAVAYYVENDFSFPSGHAAIAVAFYGFLIYLLARETKHWPRRVNFVFWGLLIILAVGLSRLYLDVHYVSDVLAGYLSGLLFLVIGITLFEWTRTWRTQTEPIALSRKKKFVAGVLILAQVGFYVVFALRYHPPLNVPKNIEVDIVGNAEIKK